jgi:hypothetical protein
MLRARPIAGLFGITFPVLVSGSPSDAGAQTLQWTLRAAGDPPGRVDHATAYDSVRAVTVVFGGSGGSQPYTDTWEWDGAAWTSRAAPGPTARVGAAMAFDSARHVIVLFGGSYTAGLLGDTWEWDGAAWTQRDVPARRRAPATRWSSTRAAASPFSSAGTTARIM